LTEKNDEAAIAAVTGVYQAGLGNLKHLVEGKQAKVESGAVLGKWSPADAPGKAIETRGSLAATHKECRH